MNTNDAVRTHVLRLVDLGVSQKVLAKRMGVSETWFSRWLNQKRPQPLVLSVAAMDGFDAYVHELLAALQHVDVDEVSATAPAAAGGDQEFEISVERIRSDEALRPFALIALRRLLASETPRGVQPASRSAAAQTPLPKRANRRGRSGSS